MLRRFFAFATTLAGAKLGRAVLESALESALERVVGALEGVVGAFEGVSEGL